MKDYDSDVIPLMKQYAGQELRSISGRADLKIAHVDDNEFTMTCSDGKEFREPHKRLRTVFKELLKSGQTHVDAALKNSGTRRNVPETLLANLPFIEHGHVDNRKHLFLKKEETHALGTLKQQDSSE